MYKLTRDGIYHGYWYLEKENRKGFEMVHYILGRRLPMFINWKETIEGR